MGRESDSAALTTNNLALLHKLEEGQDSLAAKRHWG